jgi:hypothetical protein
VPAQHGAAIGGGACAPPDRPASTGDPARPGAARRGDEGLHAHRTWVVALNERRGLVVAGFEIVDDRREKRILIHGSIACKFGLIHLDDFGVELQEATRRHRDATRGYFLLQWVEKALLGHCRTEKR